MQRALAEGEFNVVGDELRKLSVQLKNMADDRDRDHQLYRQMDSRLSAIEEFDRLWIEQGLGIGMAAQVAQIHKDTAAIEAQLTALRAEADKGTRLTEIEARLNVNSNDAALVGAGLSDLCAHLVRFEKLVSDKLALSPPVSKKKQERKRTGRKSR